MAALVVCSLVLCPVVVFKKYQKYKARKAAEKELSEEPEELEKEHRRLWAQSRNQPPSYEETVESQGTPQGAKNSTAPDMKMPPGSRGLGNTQDPTPELVH